MGQSPRPEQEVRIPDPQDFSLRHSASSIAGMVAVRDVRIGGSPGRTNECQRERMSSRTELPESTGHIPSIYRHHDLEQARVEGLMPEGIDGSFDQVGSIWSRREDDRDAKAHSEIQRYVGVFLKIRSIRLYPRCKPSMPAVTSARASEVDASVTRSGRQRRRV